MAPMVRTSDEPWFVRFRRELVHHHKSALSNPAQFLRILTGQEALHHPFTLVSSRVRKDSSEAGDVVGEANKKASEGKRAARIRERLGKDREERAIEKASLKEGIFASLPLLERCADPTAADRLLLDILLGTGRVVDDLRCLTTLMRKPVIAQVRLEVLMRAIQSLSNTIRGMRPLQLPLSFEDVNSLHAQLVCPQDMSQAVRRWLRTLTGSYSDAAGRPLCTLVSDSHQFVFSSHCMPDSEYLMQELTSDGPWVANLGSRTHKTYNAADLRILASRLLLLCDLAQGLRACSSGFSVTEARDFAFQVLSEVLQGEGEEGWDSQCALQLRFLGDQLPLAPRKADSRVPWPPDRWQRELLDAVDEGIGVLVSAPTSAGKTFAAYYAMERVLRTSNTDAVLFVAPTEALAAQVESEVHARFSQKPYPHDGYALCARWGSRLTSKAQVIVLLAQETEELLGDDGLWARLCWVICDEIHMQPLRGLKALAQQCGRAAVPFLAMSATVQNPKRMQERLAQATRCPDFKLICHSERVVDLHSFQWISQQGSLHALHPLLILDPEAMKSSTLPHMAPADALLVWQCLEKVVPDAAAELEPQFFLEKHRLGPLAKTLPPFLQIRQVCCSLAEFLDLKVLMLREQFRAWERLLARTVQSLDDSSLAQFLAILARKAGNGSVPFAETPPMSDVHPLQLTGLLRELKGSNLLPCLCFQGSAERIEVLLLGLSEVLESGARQLLEDTAEERAQVYAQQKVAWHNKRHELQAHLEEARVRARGVSRNQQEAASEERKQQRFAELHVLRQHNADQAHVAKHAKLMEVMSHQQALEEVASDLIQIFRNAQKIELLQNYFAAWLLKSENEAGRRSDMWGYDGGGGEHSQNVPRKVRDVEGDPGVRVARAALEAHEECGQPVLQEEGACADYSFEALRPKHIYQTEIEMLLEHAEKELRNLGARRGNMLWAHSLIRALRRGVAMHFSEEQAEGLNFAVQLLFRIGHVRVLLADKALSCGMNLPCRTVVMLDSEVTGASLTQMAGRAGRRGLDLFGATVYVQDLKTIRRMHAGPDTARHDTAHEQ